MTSTNPLLQLLFRPSFGFFAEKRLSAAQTRAGLLFEICKMSWTMFLEYLFFILINLFIQKNFSMNMWWNTECFQTQEHSRQTLPFLELNVKKIKIGD